MPTRARVAFVIGLVMIALGAFVAIRLLRGDPPLTRSVLLDAVFALFFAVRGMLNIRAARRVEAMYRARESEGIDPDVR